MATQAQAVAWANGGWKTGPYVKTIQGVGTGVDVDGYYGLQCADFPNAYSLNFGWGRFAGDAWQFWDTAPAVYQKVQDPQPGDIFVLANAYNNAGGHAGIVTDVQDGRTRWIAMSQNYINPSAKTGSPPVSATYNDYQLRGFLRPPLQGDAPMAYIDLPHAIDLLDRIARSQGFKQYEGNGDAVIKKLEAKYWTDVVGAIGWLDRLARELGFDKFEGNGDAILKKIDDLKNNQAVQQLEQIRKIVG